MAKECNNSSCDKSSCEGCASKGKSNPQDFLDEMQAELDRRMEEAAKFE